MFLKRFRFWLALAALLSLLAFAVACSSDDEDEAEDEDEATSTETAGGTTPYNPTGNEGTLAGTISFSGPAPEVKRISMDADPQCSNPNPVAEDVVVRDGKLLNVFIYVKDGQVTGAQRIGAYKFAVPAEEKVLDQHGCHYTPHVLGIQAGQKLKVVNSDPTAHNVNVQPQTNQKWNQSQPPGAPPIEKTFARGEASIPVKCNQHPWMKAWINVLNHPFYSVSGEGGKYEIKNLPPGTYTVEAWHEKYGTKTQQVTVGNKESKTIDFTFGEGATASAGERGPFETLPALDLPMIMNH